MIPQYGIFTNKVIKLISGFVYGLKLTKTFVVNFSEIHVNCNVWIIFRKKNTLGFFMV